jgi:hypothetical protein
VPGWGLPPCLGGIWEIIFSVPVRARASRSVARGVISSVGWRSLARKGIRSWSSSGNGECGLSAEGVFPAGLERLLEVVAHPGGGVGVEAAHAGTRWPRRCSARISGMPSSAIQVLWLCRSPCVVRPGWMGSQQVSGVPSGMPWMPQPCGGLNAAVVPGWAVGQAASGVPGQTVASAMISRSAARSTPRRPLLVQGEFTH